MILKRFLSALAAVVIVLGLVPVAALAEPVTAEAVEARKLGLLDATWAELEAVEAEMLALGATPSEVTLAVYKAASNNSWVDADSFTDNGATKFSFTVRGMHCVYDYKCRNTVYESAVTDAMVESIVEGVSAGRTDNVKNGPSSTNVLLIGPYYDSDQNFTDQYVNEATSIANATGGTLTQLINANATGPAIAAAYPDKAVVIYDSHGTQSGSSTYLCLTTNTGITSTDYSNGWAVSSGSAAYIDGRYIQNHVTEELSNCFVWMAICEGMKSNGYGTTGTALIAAGAAGVYGYSQSVTFSGDYLYEETFWTQMKNGATVAEAFATMVNNHGEHDPYGDAYPIVMSPTDAFPSNPDSAQTVTCDWQLFGSSEPVAIESATLADVMVYVEGTAAAELDVAPSNVDYTVEYSVGDTSVATVSATGVVTGVTVGTTTLTATIYDNVAQTTLVRTSTVTVSDAPKYAPVDEIVVGEEYIIGIEVGDKVYMLMNYNPSPITSGNNYYYSSSSNYWGYAAEAVLDVNGRIIGATGWTDDLQYCFWTFSTSTGGTVTSAYNSSYHLIVYNSSNYSDCYPGDDTSYNSWVWDAEANTLSHEYSSWIGSSSGTKYVGYQATAGSYSNFYNADTSTGTNTHVQLYGLYVPAPEPTTYTVTFVDWDGAVLSTQTVEEGGSATPPADPAREGYTFTGWSGSYTNVTADATVTATYAVNSYTLTIEYVYEDGTEAAAAYTEAVNYGAAYSVTSPTITGYTPDKATVSGVMGADNVSVTVTYAVNSYTLTIEYVYEDGTEAAAAYTEAVNYGAAYSVTSPTITGYTPDKATVSGVMGADNVTVTVTYTAIPVTTVNVTYTGAEVTLTAPEVDDTFYWTIGISENSKLYSGQWLIEYDRNYFLPTEVSVTWEGGITALINASIENGTQTSDVPQFVYNVNYEGQTGQNPIGEGGRYYTILGMYLTTDDFGGLMIGGDFARITYKVVAVPPTGTYELPITVLESTAVDADAQYGYADTVNTVYNGSIIVDAPQEHTVTVNYVYANGTAAAETITQTVAVGDAYSITSPEIAGYEPDTAVVSGTMGGEDINITVTYSHVVVPVTYSGSAAYLTDAQVGDTFTLDVSISDNSYWYSGNILVDYDERFLTPTDLTTSWEGGLISAINATIGTDSQYSDVPAIVYNLNYEGGTGSNPYGTVGNYYTQIGMYLTSFNHGGVMMGGAFARITYEITALPTAAALTDGYLPVPIEVVESRYYDPYAQYQYGEHSPVTTVEGKIYFTETPTYTLTINYVYADGTTAAAPYTAELAEGEGYSVNSPEITGYTPSEAVVEGTMGAENVAVTVTYNRNSYTITWVNYDGTVLETDTVSYGDMPEYNGATPTRPATAQYTYAFAGWTPEVVAVTGNATYTATFTANTNSYTITWVNYDGTVLATDAVAYGVIPVYSGATPTKPADAQYTYAFAGWTPEVVAVTGNATYTATFTANTNSYTITWVNYDGTVLATDAVAYGVIPVYSGATPTKPADAQYTYAFAGWTPEVVAVTGNATYTAVFTQTVNTYTVTFVDYDGTVLKIETVDYGASATAPSDPIREGYTFAGWDVSYTNVTADITVTAMYTVNYYILTISYVYEDGTAAAEAYTATLNYGDAYSVTSPVIDGYTPDMDIVSGTMGADNVTFTVVYTANETDNFVWGDANCDGICDFKDITLLLNVLSGNATLSEQGWINANVNGTTPETYDIDNPPADGINYADISAIYLVLLGL